MDVRETISRLQKIQTLIEDLRENFPEDYLSLDIAFESIGEAGASIDVAIDLCTKELEVRDDNG